MALVQAELFSEYQTFSVTTTLSDALPFTVNSSLVTRRPVGTLGNGQRRLVRIHKVGR